MCIAIILGVNTQAQELGGIPGDKKKFDFKKRFIFSSGLSLHTNSEIFSPGVFLEPRLNLFHTYSDFSFAATVPLSAGYNVNGSNVSFTSPLLAELSIGHTATKNFYSSFGASVASGYGMYFSDEKIHSGICFSACFRSWLLHHALTTRYMLTVPLEKSESLMHTVHLGFTIGHWLSKSKAYNKVSKFVAPYRK